MTLTLQIQHSDLKLSNITLESDISLPHNPTVCKNTLVTANASAPAHKSRKSLRCPQGRAYFAHLFSASFLPSLLFPKMEIEPLPPGPTICKNVPNEHNLLKLCAYCGTQKPSRVFKKYNTKGVSHRTSKCRDCQNECRMIPLIPYARKYPSTPRCRTQDTPPEAAIPSAPDPTVEEDIEELFRTQGASADIIDKQSERIKKLETDVATLSSLLNDVISRLPESAAANKGQPVFPSPSSPQTFSASNPLGRSPFPSGDISDRPWAAPDRSGPSRRSPSQAGLVQDQNPSTQANPLSPISSPGFIPPVTAATVAAIPPMPIPGRTTFTIPVIQPLQGSTFPIVRST